MNMTFGQALERTLFAVAILFAVLWLWDKFTTKPDLYVKPPANVVHDRCEYVSDGQPFYIGDDDRTDIDANNNGIACEPEDMR